MKNRLYNLALSFVIAWRKAFYPRPKPTGANAPVEERAPRKKWQDVLPEASRLEAQIARDEREIGRLQRKRKLP